MQDRIGECTTGCYRGLVAWVFSYDDADGKPLSWEVRFADPTVDGRDQFMSARCDIDDWEVFFEDESALTAFLSKVGIRWIEPPESGITRQRLFPLQP